MNEPAGFVLEMIPDKDQRCAGLWVKLTADPKGRRQWEFTEDFHDATRFDGQQDICNRTTDHHVPKTMYKIRPMSNAFTDYLSLINNHHNNELCPTT